MAWQSGQGASTQLPPSAATPAAAKPAAPAPATPAGQASKPVARGAAAPADPQAEAYYQFLLGRQLEARGDSDAAIAAYRRAIDLDPKSSQLPSELSELYARQGRMREAIDLADGAVTLDPENWDAHRILGMIYTDLAERGNSGGLAPGASEPPLAQHAIEHLEKSLADTRVDVATGVRLTLGRLYLQNKNYDRAISTLKQLLSDSPWLPQGVAMLAQAYTSAGKPTEAIALLKAAVEEEPSFYNSLGETYEKQHRFAEAAAAYEKAIEINPRDTDLKTRLAFALLSQPGRSNTVKARDVLLEVTKDTPTAAWPLYLLARAQRELGDLDAAENAARRILALSPTSTSGAHALAQVFEARRLYTKIVEILEPAVAKTTKGREADAVLLLTHLGFAYLELGRGADALKTFERALELAPDEESLKDYLTQSCLEAKQYDRALTLAREQRASRPTDVRVARLEADALRGLGKFDAGVAILQPLADAPGSDPLGVQALAEFYASAHRYAEGAQVLKSAQTRFPGDLGIKFQYGALLEREKLFTDAERVFREIIAVDPSHASALNYLGYTLVERGQRLPEALEFIKRAGSLDPYNGSYLDSLGWAYMKLNQLEPAEQNMRAAAERLPHDSVVQDHFGDVLAKRGRYAEAVDAWRRSEAGDGEQIDRALIERKIRDAQPKIGKE